MFLAYIFLTLSLIVAAASSNCPNGTSQSSSYPNKCFYFGTQQLGYMNAEKQCLNFHGHLTSIHSLPEDISVSQSAGTAFSGTGATDFWFGLNKMTGDNWEWIDGTSFKFTNWDTSEPKNQTDNICGAISIANGKWSARNCFEVKPFVCEIYVSNFTTTTTTTLQPDICPTSFPVSLYQCSDQQQRTCGDCLAQRAQRVCSVFPIVSTKYDCPDEELAKMCCENECSDCDIRKCRCP